MKANRLFWIALALCAPLASAQTPAGTDMEAARASATPPEVLRPAGSARIGDATRSLLAAQADGSIAGSPLPMLGATAGISWQRYLESFSHKVPPFFDTKVVYATGNR